MTRRILIALATAALFMLSACAAGVPLMSEPLEPPPAFEPPEKEKEVKEGEEKETRVRKQILERDRALPEIPEDMYFTLIYYVGISKNDRRRAVVLDIEDDAIDFIPTVRDFEYEILQNVSLPEALFETDIFYGYTPIIYDFYFSRVLGPDGKTIGYELRPVYVPWFYGVIDPLLIEYTYKRRRVSVTIKLAPGVSEPQ